MNDSVSFKDSGSITFMKASLMLL